ncbi:mitochondrial carrier domain-containing protein [Phyllosticta capitalensis]|uniref:asparagine--tRNA ligase n=1 Tax=Phyllosticta capitalensis TaxID=121624 RepID=A0ABR1YYI6_9PEZI
MLVGPRRLMLLRPLCPRSALPSHTVRLVSTSSRSTIARLLNTAPSSSSLAQHSSIPVAGETVSVNGWVRSVRKQKRIAFAAVGDGSSLAPLQVVMSPELATGLSTGVGVAITGQWQPSPPGKQQAQELHAQQVRVLGENDSTKYPLQKKFHTTEFLRTLPHLRTRTPFNSLMLRLRSQVIAQVTAFFAARDFVQTHPPVITSSDCEGSGEVFTIAAQGEASESNSGSSSPGEHFFRHPKYLTVSSQLHLEALAQSVGNVWCLCPSFRAEKSSTPRHLSEFYMLEAELSFVEKLDDVMDSVEEMLRHVAVTLRDSTVGRELLAARSPEYSKSEENDGITAESLSRRWEGLCRSNWPRISFADAVTKLQEASKRGEVSFQFTPSFDQGLQTEHEAFIANTIGQGSPVFVTDYPRSVKPFYMAPTGVGSSQNHPSETVACFDLLVPDTCELVGGSLREHRLPELLAAMDSHGLKLPAQRDDINGVSAASYESLPPNYSLAANMTAGAFAGIAEHSVMYPIDLLKTRMQVANPSPTAVYSGISNAMITITRLEGFRTLWRGVSSVVMGAGPAHAVYFATYEAVKHAAGGNEGGKHEHHPFAAALSGASATIASDALMNPFDVIKQRMQLHGSSYKTFADCAKSVFRNEGVGAFYVSYPTTLCMTVPFTALQFVAYESLSKTMNPTGRWDPYTHCTAGGLAGGLAAGVTTPLDVIKTLLQTRGSAAEAELRNVRGLWEAAKIIKRRDGWRGFFRGLKPRIVTTMPSTAICWSVCRPLSTWGLTTDTASGPRTKWPRPFSLRKTARK